ncbi:MAG: MarR family transcriptional regulator [Desulfobacteraceae bacterium 4572_35.1]|nr:MAG: MarR family transcriptional regulator [Desulfobacteraceae bacterium 4572_35.1]
MTEFNIESSVGFLLTKAHQHLHARFRELLLPYGLTPQQFALLAFLWQEDGRSQRLISEKTDVDRTTLSGVLDRLQKMGLVMRLPDPDDRRAWQIFLTDAGRELEKKVAPLINNLRQQLFKEFAPGEYEQLCYLLAKLRKGDVEDEV